jgi:PBP1b-binding outer membrane lipoprotein LpoB
MNFSLRRGVANAAVAVLGFSSVGCAYQQATGPQRVRDSEQRVTTLGIDVADIEEAAARVSQELLNSGTLGANGSPSILLIDDKAFINNTSENIPSSRILKKVRVALTKAGVSQTIVKTGEAAEQGQIDAFLNDAPLVHDYAIQLVMDEDRATAGRTRERTYFLQLLLADRRGLAVWEGEEQITKQQTSGGFGF